MSEANLTTEQVTFLRHLVNSGGNAYEAMKKTNIDQYTLLQWRKQATFIKQYDELILEVQIATRAAIDLLCEKRRLDILTNGHQEETITTTTTIKGKGVLSHTQKSVVKKSTPHPSIINNSEVTLEDSILTLVKEGVLPLVIARNIFEKCNSKKVELLEAFDLEEKESNNSDQQIGAMVKAGILGDN